jgi:hypothetical protein
MSDRKEEDKAIVLVSGGMGSCVTAAIAGATHELTLVPASHRQWSSPYRRGYTFYVAIV